MKNPKEKPNGSGFILEPVFECDWEFGDSKLGLEDRVPDGNWIPYLPSNEKQTKGYRTSACTNFSSTSCIEIDFTYRLKNNLISPNNLKWLKDNGYFDDNGNINFSDRFDAVVSGTEPSWGNSLKTVAEAKRKYGLIPERMLPWAENVDEYFDENNITPEMYAMGQEFLKRFPINYEVVYDKDYVSALKKTPLAGAVYAWNGSSDGIYYRVENKLNHAIAIIEPKPVWQIYDSFNPHIKKLADNYNFLYYTLRYIIRENEDVVPNSSNKKMYVLLRNPNDAEEIFAFTQDMKAKRHIVNKETLKEGNKSPDQCWVWEGDKFPIEWATPSEFKNAIEMAEILLLPPDSDSKQAGLSFWKQIINFIKGLWTAKNLN